MKNIPPFTFERSRGIIWVCDIEKSSSYLNDPELADDIEEFLPRFYYVSKLIVETYGGIYLKWTGDGFLAFFKVELDRDIPKLSNKIFDAAFNLGLMSSLTQMGLSPKKNFWIRHGVAYEKDGLLMNIQVENEQRLDIIGRSVVLAFRLSGISADFPSIVTVKELADKSDRSFINWKATREEKLRYFKGEKFAINEIKVAGVKGRKIKDWGLEGKKLGERIIKRRLNKDKQIIMKVLEKMDDGPDWCKQISSIEKQLLDDNLVKPFNALLDTLRKAREKKIDN